MPGRGISDGDGLPSDGRGFRCSGHLLSLVGAFHQRLDTGSGLSAPLECSSLWGSVAFRARGNCNWGAELFTNLQQMTVKRLSLFLRRQFSLPPGTPYWIVLTFPVIPPYSKVGAGTYAIVEGP